MDSPGEVGGVNYRGRFALFPRRLWRYNYAEAPPVLVRDGWLWFGPVVEHKLDGRWLAIIDDQGTNAKNVALRAERRR